MMIRYENNGSAIFRTTERRDGYITGIQNGMKLYEDKQGHTIIGNENSTDRKEVADNDYRYNRTLDHKTEKSF